MALDEERLVRVGEFGGGCGRPLGKREQLGAGDARQFVFIRLADVDEQRRGGGREALLRLDHRDFWNGHWRRQLEIDTGVPTFTFSKNFWAMNPGMRMHPWDAG